MAPTTIVHERCGSVRSSWRLGHDGGSVQRHSLSRNNGRTTSLRLWLWHAFCHLFLPEGYPNSVSPDYARYQMFDTAQALCSSVVGTLSTRAILHGVGVGEAEATVLAGTLQWVVRDGSGMVGRIAFASVVASDLDNDAKRWRLAADVTNDIAFLLEIFSSHVPRVHFLPIVIVAGLFRSVTAVAGGATRASLTQHFATRKNTADVAAKDGSQETAVNLIGMFVGMAVATLVPETFVATCVVVLLLTAMHLLANYYGERP